MSIAVRKCLSSLLLAFCPLGTLSCGAGAGDDDRPTSGIGSFGVDSATWPRTVEAARSALGALPNELHGAKKSSGLPDDAHQIASVTYEDSRHPVGVAVTVMHVPQPGMDVRTAASLLFYQYFEDARCRAESYSGTIGFDKDARGPSVAPEASRADSPWWYSCLAATGDEVPGALALGWVSAGDLAWQVAGSDRPIVQALLDRLAISSNQSGGR